MVALVTGANGFLGGYIADALAGAGHEVARAGRPEVEVPSPELARLVRERPPGLVVHCAGPASVAGSMEDPHRDFEGSVVVLSDLLELLRALPDPPRTLLLSSAAVYGEPRSLPIGEDAEPAPLSPYGFHRLACEVIAHEYHEIYGLPTAAMRIFSAYGEGLRRQILWDVCRRLLDEGEAELFGTGEESRDFVHASDVARAALAIADGGAFEGEHYNVASGRETTVAELAGLLARTLGLDPGVITFSGKRRAGDPANWRADIARVAALGFEPRVPIEDGATAYARWAAGRPETPAGPPSV